MKNWTTKSGYKIYQVLSLRSNAFLIEAGGFKILVDTGRKIAYKKLLKNLSFLDCKGIDYLILTHTHYDHCQNAFALKELYKCKIVASMFESDFAIAGYTPVPKGTVAPARMISALGRILGDKIAGYKPFNADMIVGEHLGFKKDMGLNIDVIHTPGHSPGSLSVIIDGEIAIVGDTLFGVLRDSIFPPFADDIPLMKKSWKQLLDTGCTLFLPGHGRRIRIETLKNALIIN
ncbi:MAG: MBL fold metallo-hydrolase [Bacteroidales bacterium]|jgi:glyoxylase-like metal-dependent hydrolase (beta-lactamase superfamily II)